MWRVKYVASLSTVLLFFASACQLNPKETPGARASNEINLGIKAWGAGDKVKAKGYFDRAASMDQYAVLAYYYRILIEDEDGEWNNVIIDVTHLISVGYPETIELLTLRGQAQERKGEYSLALKDYQRIIEVMPEDFRGYLFAASAYESRGDLAKALESYQVALQKIEPDSKVLALIHYQRGACLAKTGKTDEGMEEIRKAEKLDPNFRLPTPTDK